VAAACLGQAQYELRQTQATLASKMLRGDSTRLASIDREIVQLERRVARLKQVLR